MTTRNLYKYLPIEILISIARHFCDVYPNGDDERKREIGRELVLLFEEFTESYGVEKTQFLREIIDTNYVPPSEIPEEVR